jgi:hypothetical protein
MIDTVFMWGALFADEWECVFVKGVQKKKKRVLFSEC